MQKHRNSIFRFILVFLFLFIFQGYFTAVFSQTPAKPARLAILPFEARATKDLSYLTSGIRDMLASRMAANSNLKVIEKPVIDQAVSKAGKLSLDEDFQSLGRNLQADYLVAGSITAFGNSYSLDVKVFTAVGPARPNSFYASAATENDIITAVDQLALNIGEKMFGVQRPDAAPAQPLTQTVPVPQETPYQTAHPERAYMGQAAGGGASPFIRPAGGGPMGFTKSQNFSMGLEAMDVGDVDGDGQDEIVLADRQDVLIYKRTGNRFAKVGKIPVLATYKIHAVSVADIDNNGKAEIYVSTVDRVDPHSFGVEWLGKADVKYIFEDADWYIKAINLPGEGLVLAGQGGGLENPITPGIYRLHVTGTEVVKGEKINVPDWVNLFGFAVADIDKDGISETVAIDEYDRLYVLDATGDKLWKSDEHFGGTTRFIGGKEIFGTGGTLPQRRDDADDLDAENRVYIPSRIIITDVNQDGQQDVVLNKNLSTASRILKNLKRYPSGEIHALTWNGIALTELWRTRKIDGYIADYQLVPNKDASGAELFVGLVLRQGSLSFLKPGTSTVLMYQLDYTEQNTAEPEQR